jgi:hypothetical protein
MADNPLPPDSRYHGLEVATTTAADGSVQPYLRRRFLPPSSSLAVLGRYTVVQGDRIDRVAAATLGLAELSWQLVDANDALHAEALTLVIGRRLVLTLPEGVPAPAQA